MDFLKRLFGMQDNTAKQVEAEGERIVKAFRGMADAAEEAEQLFRAKLGLDSTGRTAEDTLTHETGMIAKSNNGKKRLKVN